VAVPAAVAGGLSVAAASAIVAGLGRLVATHDHAILESIPARTLMLHQGQIHYDGMWPP
jgi:ABC-type ATPase involved in cell division